MNFSEVFRFHSSVEMLPMLTLWFPRSGANKSSIYLEGKEFCGSEKRLIVN